MSEDRSKQLHTLETTKNRLRALTADATDAMLDFRPEEAEWSIREILAHLVDDEMYVMRTRAERMIKEVRPDLAPHDEKYWYAHRNTNRDQLDQLVGDFELQRDASLHMLKMLRESDWVRTGFQPEYGEFTVEQWLGHWVTHDLVHLRQIEANVKAYHEAALA